MTIRKPGYAALLDKLALTTHENDGVALIRIQTKDRSSQPRPISLGEQRLQSVLDVALPGSAAEGMGVSEQIRVVLAVRERQQSRATLM